MGDDGQRWAGVAGQVAAGGYDDLSADERSWYCVRTLLDAIEDGGLIGYYAGPGADRLADCVPALTALKAGPIVTLLSFVNKLFPFGVPTDATSRRGIIDSWSRDESLGHLLGSVEEQAAAEVPWVRQRLASFLREAALDG
jgi:hypothetical protein